MNTPNFLADPELDELIAQMEELYTNTKRAVDSGGYNPDDFGWEEFDIPPLSKNPADYIPQWQPSDPAITNRQRSLSRFYCQWGVRGLWYQIYKIAKEQKKEEEHNGGKAHPSWDMIIEDYLRNNKSRGLYYLSSLPPRIIQALIDGDLPSCMEDPEFRQEVRQYVSLAATQGVYIIYLARLPAQHHNQSQGLERPGQNMSSEQLSRVLDQMRQYIDVAKTPTPYDPLPVLSRNKNQISFCKSIDMQFPEGGCIVHDYAEGKGRYSPSHEAIYRIGRWIDFMQVNLIDKVAGLGNGQESIPLQRCFPYVGLGVQCATRATAHHAHKGNESPLYGLFTAATKKLFGREFDVVPYTYQIIRTVRKEDIGLDEVLISILASAYSWDSGLCINQAGQQRGSRAGKSIKSDVSVTYEQEFKTNAREIQQHGFIQTNLQDSDSKIQRWRDDLPKMKKFATDHAGFLEKLKNQHESVSSLLEQAKNAKIDSEIAILQEAEEAYQVEKASKNPNPTQL